MNQRTHFTLSFYHLALAIRDTLEYLQNRPTHPHQLYLAKKNTIALSLKENSKNLKVVKAALEGNFSRKEYVSFDENNMSGSLVRLPERDEFLKEINEQLIVEFYNR